MVKMGTLVLIFGGNTFLSFVIEWDVSCEIFTINIIRNENGDNTNGFIEIKRIIKEHHELLFTNKLENLDEMEKF